jgi:Ca2+-transporting ATPase
MITGDHPVTAHVIARELGIASNGTVISGSELQRMPDEELEGTAGEVAVYARVNPEHKLRIVKALQKSGAVVAMTGDGVNDAPALKTADIGVAMGITGTDVSKQAADMVLADDNFATIVAAVEEGRSIFSNIRKFLRFLLSSNMGEVLTMFFGVLPTPAWGASDNGKDVAGHPIHRRDYGRRNAGCPGRIPARRAHQGKWGHALCADNGIYHADAISAVQCVQLPVR